MPAATSDGAGGLIATWPDARNGPTDIFAMRVQSDGLLHPSWPTNGVAVCTAAQAQNSPAITSDNSGGAYIAWTDSRNGANSDIFLQHVLSSGSIDPTWPANGLAVCLATGNQRNANIIPDGSGGAIVTWDDERNFATTNFDIYSQRVSSAGSALWTVNGVAVCDAAGLQDSPKALSDNGGGAIITWTDLRSGATGRDIFAHHLTSSGARDAGWPSQGTALTTAADEQERPAITTDGGTGAIVAWQDLRNGTDYDVYAARVTAAGTVMWSANGSPASTSNTFAWEVQTVPDGSGGLFLTWTDLFGGDIYAQHLANDGTVALGWPQDGLGVCTAIGPQSGATIVSDNASGAIIAWGDGRLEADENIFAQRVTALGEAGPTTAVSNPSVASLQLSASPNPAKAVIEFDVTMPADDRITIRIMDISGRVVAELADAVLRAAGIQRFAWPLVSRKGTRVAAGIYFAQAAIGDKHLGLRFAVVE